MQDQKNNPQLQLEELVLDEVLSVNRIQQERAQGSDNEEAEIQTFGEQPMDGQSQIQQLITQSNQIPEHILQKYISKKKLNKEEYQQFLQTFYPTYSLQLKILFQKLQEDKKFELIKKIQQSIAEGYKILTTSHATKYLVEFFIMTVIIENFKNLTNQNVFKKMTKKKIFKEILWKQCGGQKKKFKRGYNCSNLKLLLQSKYITDQMLDQFTIINIISNTSNTYEQRMYYICFIPKLKQIKRMNKQEQYKQVWNKNDKRSIQYAEQILKHHIIDGSPQLSEVEIQSLSQLIIDLSDKQNLDKVENSI